METETSTAALAVTVKPQLNPQVVLTVVAAGVIAAGAVVAVRSWRKRKQTEIVDAVIEPTSIN